MYLKENTHPPPTPHLRINAYYMPCPSPRPWKNPRNILRANTKMRLSICRNTTDICAHMQQLIGFQTLTIQMLRMLLDASTCDSDIIWNYIHSVPWGNVPDFGRMILTLKYTDITQNTYIRSWKVTEIMAREKCGLLAVPRTVPVSRGYPYTAHVRPSVSQPSQAHSDFIINRCHSYSEL